MVTIIINFLPVIEKYTMSLALAIRDMCLAVR